MSEFRLLTQSVPDGAEVRLRDPNSGGPGRDLLARDIEFVPNDSGGFLLIHPREKHTPFSDVFWLERYWINQPSTLQPYHKWHGARVIAYIAPGDRYTTAYFTSGNIISTRIAVEALSKGWPNSEASVRNSNAR